MKINKGFSLVELLIVMALTTLMLTIIFAPFTQSVRMLLTGQGEVGLQSEVKNVLNLISKDISKAVKIKKSDFSIVFKVPKSLGAREVQTRSFLGCSLDLWLPEEGGKEDGKLINPRINKTDPTLRGQEGKEVLPIHAGGRFVRYFVGLKDPTQPYNIKKGNLLVKANTEEDNPFVVYRAEMGAKEKKLYFPINHPSEANQEAMIRSWRSCWSKVSKIVHRTAGFDAIEVFEKKDTIGQQFSPLIGFNFLSINHLEEKPVNFKEIDYPDEKPLVLQRYFSPFDPGSKSSLTEPFPKELNIPPFDEEDIRKKDLQGLLGVLRSTENPNERYLCTSLIAGLPDNPFDIPFNDYGKRYWLLDLGGQVIVPGTDRLYYGDQILTRVTQDPIKPDQYKIRYSDAEEIPSDVFNDTCTDGGQKEILLEKCITPMYKGGFIDFCPDSTYHLPEGIYTFKAQVVRGEQRDLQKNYISAKGLRIDFGLTHYVEANMKRPQIFSMQKTVRLKNL